MITEYTSLFKKMVGFSKQAMCFEQILLDPCQYENINNVLVKVVFPHISVKF